MKAAALLLLLAAAPAIAQDGEDAAHRADRLRTQALNARSPSGYASSYRSEAAPSDRAEYEDARADYRRRLAEWRRRVAACQAGYYDACER